MGKTKSQQNHGNVFLGIAPYKTLATLCRDKDGLLLIAKEKQPNPAALQSIACSLRIMQL
jgi:hypothetical protein